MGPTCKNIILNPLAAKSLSNRLCMSPVSTNFPIIFLYYYLWHQKKKQLFNSTSTTSLFIWETRVGNGSFWIKVLTLVQNIIENKLRHARGPVHVKHRVRYIYGFQGRKEDASADNKKRSFAPTGYSDTKLMNGLFAKSLAQKFPQIQAFGVCPGNYIANILLWDHLPVLVTAANIGELSLLPYASSVPLSSVVHWHRKR